MSGTPPTCAPGIHFGRPDLWGVIDWFADGDISVHVDYRYAPAEARGAIELSVVECPCQVITDLAQVVRPLGDLDVLLHR